MTILIMEGIMLIGYARVSTQGQSLASQIDALKSAGCERIFQEKESGAKTNRPELAKAIKALGEGGVLVITALDRLARSTRDLLNTLDIVSAKGASFRSLKDTWADTSTPHGKLMVTVLGGLAEFERELIRVRTGDGRQRAQDRGVKFGPKHKLTPFQTAEVRTRKAAGESVRDLARSYGVGAATISRLTSDTQ